MSFQLAIRGSFVHDNSIDDHSFWISFSLLGLSSKVGFKTEVQVNHQIERKHLQKKSAKITTPLPGAGSCSWILEQWQYQNYPEPQMRACQKVTQHVEPASLVYACMFCVQISNKGYIHIRVKIKIV